MWIVEINGHFYGAFLSKTDAWAWIHRTFPDDDYKLHLLESINR